MTTSRKTAVPQRLRELTRDEVDSVSGAFTIAAEGIGISIEKSPDGSHRVSFFYPRKSR